jgi:hypothetical protein
MTYRTGNHWGVTIVREGVPLGENGATVGDQLIAVVVNGDQALAERIVALLNMNDENYATWLAGDSCTCRPTAVSTNQPDPSCPVHRGRRARGPKPPPVGPGCICDGSGRTCPRHGAVI